jgi:hypothetical protein
MSALAQTKYFYNFFVHVNIILGKYFLSQDIVFVDVEKYFATCPWMNDLYG